MLHKLYTVFTHSAGASKHLLSKILLEAGIVLSLLKSQDLAASMSASLDHVMNYNAQQFQNFRDRQSRNTNPDTHVSSNVCYKIHQLKQ